MKPPPNSVPTPPPNPGTQPPNTPPSTPPVVPDPGVNSAPRGVPFDPGALGDSDGDRPKWSRAWIALAVVLVAYIAFMAVYNLGARSQRPMPLGPVTTQNSALATVSVDVAGAVARPGVYSLRTDARVSDALAAAGGTLPDADQSALNLAAFVQDGAKISVPSRIAASPAPASPVAIASPPVVSAQPATAPSFSQPSTSETTSPAGVTPAQAARTATATTLRANPIDLNTATSEQLQQLPGVGPSLAQKILDYRILHGRFNSVGDLDSVKGIGQKRMDDFKDMVVVR